MLLNIYLDISGKINISIVVYKFSLSSLLDKYSTLTKKPTKHKGHRHSNNKGKTRNKRKKERIKNSRLCLLHRHCHTHIYTYRERETPNNIISNGFLWWCLVALFRYSSLSFRERETERERREGEEMQKRRWRPLVVLRKLLTCAIGAIALVALFSVHLHVFPPSNVPKFTDPYKLPTVNPPLLILSLFPCKSRVLSSLVFLWLGFFLIFNFVYTLLTKFVYIW